MKPIRAPQIVDNGIAVYCPKLNLRKEYLLKIEIFYSLNKQNYFWLCKTNPKLLWQKQTEVNDSPTLFIYRQQNLLSAGFYRIRLTGYAQGQEFKGERTIGILKPTKTLNLGLEFSIYPAIELS